MNLIEQVKRLAELQEKATPRPWMHHKDEDEYEPHAVVQHPGPGSHIGLRYIAELGLEAPLAYENAAFISEAGSLDFAALHAALATPPAAPATGVAGEAPFAQPGNRPAKLPPHNPGSSFGSHYLLMKMPEYQQVPAVVGYYDFKRNEWFDHAGAQVDAPVEWWPIAWPGYPKKVIGRPHPHPGFVTPAATEAE